MLECISTTRVLEEQALGVSMTGNRMEIKTTTEGDGPGHQQTENSHLELEGGLELEGLPSR